MTPAQLIRLVAGREIRDRLGNRGFVGTTLVVLLVLVGFVVIPTLVTDDGPTTYDLGLLGDAPTDFGPAIAAGAEVRDVVIDLVEVADRGTAVELIEAGDLDAVLIDGRQLLVDDPVTNELQSLVDGAVGQTRLMDELAAAGADRQAALSALSSAQPIEVVTISGASEQERQSGAAAGAIATVLLFLMIQINGTTLMTGTIEEKSSRVVEVLLGTLRPWHLLSGKLLGIVVLSVGQLLLYLGGLLGANAIVDAFEVPDATRAMVIVGSLMFIVGFGLYAAAFAVAGSLASSAEDAQASAGPIGILAVSIYMAVLIGVVPEPASTLAKVLTFLPPSAPFAVPVRLAAGAIETWEVVVAAFVTLAGTVLAIRLAGRLYSAALLSGGRLTWREVFRAPPIGS